MWAANFARRHVASSQAEPAQWLYARLMAARCQAAVQYQA